MLPRTIRLVCIVAIASLLVGATVLAGDPWNTKSLWNTGNPWNAPTASFGVVPSPIPVPASLNTPVPPITTNGIGLHGNPSAGAHIVMMKCAGCHGEDGSGKGVQLGELSVKQPPIPWNDATAMSALSDQEIAEKISSTNRQQKPDAVMPSFGDQLSPQQIDDVVAYIRMLAR